MKLQQFLLDELEDSKNNPGHTHHGETYDNNIYVSMKAFWDLFTGEITLEYTCISCKSTIKNREPINYLLLKFPDDNDKKCDTVQSLIEIIYRKLILRSICAVAAKKILQQHQSLPLLSFPPSCAFYSVAVEETVMAPLLQRLSILPLVST
jgi:hypothetical protein